MSPNLVVIENKLGSFFNNSVLSLFVIGIIALFIRILILPFNIPITLDAMEYFWYASDTSILGHLPTGYVFANNGWPVFLSFFFYLFRFENTIDYFMNMQRVITAVLSTLTIIPVYFLCKRFFDKPYALIGAAIFAFEPRIIQNSLAGLTEPLYILLGTTAFVLFLSSNKKLVYVSFGVTALASLVRSEALFLLFIISILFLIRYRKERNVIPRYLLALAIFVAIVYPMVTYRIQTEGSDALFNRIPTEAHSVLVTNEHTKSSLFLYVIHGFENFFRFFGWDLIPVLIFFVPCGLIMILKNRTKENMMFILFLIIMSLPALYAYSIPASDTRYLFFLYPMFCVISIYPIRKLCNRVGNQKLVLILIIGGVLLSSSVFLEYKGIDYQHEVESMKIAKYVIQNTNGVNEYYPEDIYLVNVQMPLNWPVLKATIPLKNTVIPTDNYTSLKNFIEDSKNKGLTHLVVDGKPTRPEFLNDVFYHEEKYPYLVKVFDSYDYNYKYHLKIYKIDYTKFNQ